MALSNSNNYTIDRDTIITDAFQLLGIGVEGETISSTNITIAARALNLMLKAWTVHGLQVWKRKTYLIDPLVLSKQYYSLGTPPTVACTLAGSGTTATVTLRQHDFTTGNSVTISGATDTDYNGVYTITVVDANTFTYTAGGTLDPTDSGACLSNEAYDILRPERILSVDRIDSIGNEVDLIGLSRDEFDDLPNKTTEGTPTEYHYERRLGAGRLYIWPVADASTVTNYTLEITYQSVIDDLDSATDDLDMPQEWMEAVVSNLAKRLQPKFDTLDTTSITVLRTDADDFLEVAKNYDIENVSLYFKPRKY